MNNICDARKYSRKVFVTYVPFLTQSLTFGEVQYKCSTSHAISYSYRTRRDGLKDALANS